MKQRDIRKYLYDIETSAQLIQKFIANKSLADYEADLLLRSGVERQFEIIGEALRQASEVDSSITARISSFQRIIDFRNQLAHGYASVRNDIVWAVAQNDLPLLQEEVHAWMSELRSQRDNE